MAGLFFRRSLAQDDVDRYNTWVVLFLSFLALVFLLVPFSFKLGSSSKSAKFDTGSNKMAPMVKATCWTPTQFEYSQVRYTDKFCNHQANMMFKGLDTTGRFVSDLEHTRNVGPHKNISFIDTFVKQSVLERQEERRTRSDQVGKKIQEFVNFRTPVVLFLLALCLKLPYIFCSLLKSTRASCINIDQILGHCVESRSLDVATQREIHNVTATAVAKSTRQFRNTASVLYLLLKLSTFLIVLMEVIFIPQYIIPDILAMENDLIVENPVNETKPISEGITTTSQDHLQNGIESPSIYHCFFEIRMLTNVHAYTVQCLVTRVEEPAVVTHDASDVNRQATPLTNQSKVLMYQALFTIVLALLATLAIANIFNTVSWFLRLTVSSYATSMELPSNAAMDVVLLTHMAWLNAGPVVARGLVGSNVWSSRLEETDTEPIIESKA